MPGLLRRWFRQAGRALSEGRLIVAPAFDTGYSRVELHYKNGKLEYPPEHIGRRKYVTVKGFPYSVPACYCYMGGDGRWHYCAEEIPEGVNAPMVMRDMSGYVSPLDGSYVGSRSHHREHMNRHGVIERGNEPMRARPTEMNMPRAGYDIKRAMGKL